MIELKPQAFVLLRAVGNMPMTLAQLTEKMVAKDIAQDAVLPLLRETIDQGVLVFDGDGLLSRNSGMYQSSSQSSRTIEQSIEKKVAELRALLHAMDAHGLSPKYSVTSVNSVTEKDSPAEQGQ